MRLKGLICDLLFLQVLTAFPVEPQFTFSSQSQGEPFPLENCSSMGEGQVKTLWAVLILQRYPTCGWSYKNLVNMVWHFNCLVLIGEEIRRGFQHGLPPYISYPLLLSKLYCDTSRVFKLSSKNGKEHLATSHIWVAWSIVINCGPICYNHILAEVFSFIIKVFFNCCLLCEVKIVLSSVLWCNSCNCVFFFSLVCRIFTL